MSAHFSKFGLNTYFSTPYFRSQVPDDYPLSLVLQKSRAFRRLPPNLRKLSAKAKQWARTAYPAADFGGIDEWYDAAGNELNSETKKRLTDEEIDAQWPWDKPDIEVKDIPIPPGGFADPNTWEELKEEDTTSEDDDMPTEAQILSDIKHGGRKRAVREYGAPDGWESAKSDEDLARMIVARRTA